MDDNKKNNTDNTADTEIVLDTEDAGADPAVRIKKIRDDLKQCAGERREYLDGWQRAKADLMNYKKDEARRFAEIAQYLGAEFVQDFLPVLDSFDLALASIRVSGGSGILEQGVMMVRSQMLDILKKKGVAPLETTSGDAFDPNRHESMGEAESDKPAGTVAEVIQQGYTLHGRLIRPARVRLAKEKTDPQHT